MGHRALVAYERQDGTYNVHYTHWGASNLRLRTAITKETPLGGENSEPDFVSGLLAALSENADDVGGYLTEPQDASEVEPEPHAVGVTFEEILSDILDYLHHEAFYVVDRDFNVGAYRTLWFDMCYDIGTSDDGRTTQTERRSVTVGFGAIVKPRWYPDPDEHPDEAEPVGDGMDRGAFDGAKSLLSRMVRRGTLTEEDAYGWLREFVEHEFGDHGGRGHEYGLQFGFDELPDGVR